MARTTARNILTNIWDLLDAGLLRFAKPGISIANLIFAGIVLVGYVVKVHGKAFLPLDHEQKISFAVAHYFALTVVFGCLAVIAICLLSLVSAWKELPLVYRLAGIFPLVLISAFSLIAF